VAASVIVADDHPLFRQGLVVALGTQARFEVVGEASNGEEAMQLVRERDVDVAIIDVLMPKQSGISLATDLHQLRPSCRVLGLSVIDEPGLIADMLRAQASGFALKTQPFEELLEALDHVMAGIRYLPPTVSAAAVDEMLVETPNDPFQRLTRREREVFELMIRGNSNDEIATQLFIARRTVETHRQRVMNKLSAHSVAQLQRLAARYGGLGA
jgi:two-component system, NarL family, response regulator NreC